jgi:hypothetical protein
VGRWCGGQVRLAPRASWVGERVGETGWIGGVSMLDRLDGRSVDAFAPASGVARGETPRPSSLAITSAMC